jgi:Protein of unknown function (DUF4012)
VYTISTLPKEIPHYTQKLLQLKEPPKKKGVLELLFKYQLKPHFFTIITSLLVVCIIAMSFLGNLNSTKQHISENNDLLGLKLKSLIELSGLDRQNALQAIKQTLTDSLKPIAQFSFTTQMIERDTQDIEGLISDWLQVLDPLYQYTFSAEGFNHKSDSKRSFTTDLELFFDALPQLQQKTEKVWGQMWLYRAILNISNNDKAKEVVGLLESFIQNIPSFIRLKPLILQILGHYSTQRMVIFNQNTGEARPTGGFTGSYIPLDISQGKFILGESQSIYYVDGQKKEGVVSHPATWYYDYLVNGKNFIGGIRNLNVFNCFPDTALTIEKEFSTSGNGYSIDQLVMINPQFLQSLLPDDFAFTVPEVGNINQQNFLDVIERISSFQAPERSNPKSLIGPVFKALLSQLPEIIKTEGVGTILGKITQSMRARDVNIWFRNPQIQATSSSLGFASEQVCENTRNKSVITPLITNISADKRGLIAQNRFNIRSEPVWGGRRLYVTYIQNLPESKNLQRSFNNGIAFTMTALQIPKNALNIKISCNYVLQASYLRVGYLNNLTQDEEKSYTIPPTIQTTIDTGKDLPGGGFTYNQPDGSLVAGVYISDNNTGETVVNYEFTLPISSLDRVDFYGQPGLNEPSLFLGDGVEMYKNPDIKQITDPQTIQSGITLITR